LPEGITNIGQYAFYNCSSLESIIIPANVTKIGIYAFQACSKLTSVEFENETGWFVTTSSSSAATGTGVVVTDKAKNATYLKSTYCNYYWKRKV
jgi:hypothetical protein